MFTCARIKATKGKGADFYRQHLSCNDYYSEHEVVKGVWRGSLAEDFDLSNKTVDPSVFIQAPWQILETAPGEGRLGWWAPWIS